MLKAGYQSLVLVPRFFLVSLCVGESTLFFQKDVLMVLKCVLGREVVSLLFAIDKGGIL